MLLKFVVYRPFPLCNPIIPSSSLFYVIFKMQSSIWSKAFGLWFVEEEDPWLTFPMHVLRKPSFCAWTKHLNHTIATLFLGGASSAKRNGIIHQSLVIRRCVRKLRRMGDTVSGTSIASNRVDQPAEDRINRVCNGVGEKNAHAT